MSTTFWPLVPRRLERPARVVEPHVDALHQVAADVDVVVLDEHDAAGEAAASRVELGDLRSSCLPGVVARVGLAGEDELDRALTGGRSSGAAARGR